MELSDIEPFIGKWRLVDSKNFEEYLQATGAPKLISDLFTKVKPLTEIKMDSSGTSLTFITSFKVKSIIQSARIDGTEHEIDIPILKSFKKNKAVTRSKLTFDKTERVMTIEVNRSDGKERNTAKRWIDREAETNPESGNAQKVRMILELICERMIDERDVEKKDLTPPTVVRAVRVFERK